jgi:hypothetical protein
MRQGRNRRVIAGLNRRRPYKRGCSQPSIEFCPFGLLNLQEISSKSCNAAGPSRGFRRNSDRPGIRAASVCSKIAAVFLRCLLHIGPIGRGAGCAPRDSSAFIRQDYGKIIVVVSATVEMRRFGPAPAALLISV